MFWLLPLLLVTCNGETRHFRDIVDDEIRIKSLKVEGMKKEPAVMSVFHPKIDAFGNRSLGPVPGTLDVFGCKFIRNHKAGPYQLSDLNARQWGEELQYMVFDTQEEFDRFYHQLEKIRKLLISTYAVNTMTPFLQFWDSFNRSGIQSAEMFYRDYVATLYTGNKRKADCDEISMVLRLYETLVKMYPKLKDHFVMGVSDLRVSKKVLTFCKNATLLDEPTENFDLEHITGVIKVLVKGEFGYVLLDPNYYLGPACVLMRGGAPCSRRLKTPRREYAVTYTMLGGDNGYVRYEIRDDNNKVNPILLRTHILYVKTSLCSFLQSVGKLSLLNPYRVMKIADENGNHVISSCEVILLNSDSTNNTQSKNNFDILTLYRIPPENYKLDEYFQDEFKNLRLPLNMAKDISEDLTSHEFWLIHEIKNFHQLSLRKRNDKADEFLTFISTRFYKFFTFPKSDRKKGLF